MMGWLGAILWIGGFAAYGGTSEMECDSDTAKLIAKGPLREVGPWTEWRIEKCAGQKPTLRVVDDGSSLVVYQAKKSKLASLGFLDAKRPARKLEDIGTTWRISQGVHGYVRPVWILREGKDTLVFVDMLQQPLSALGVINEGCKGQVNLDPTSDGFVVTVRKADSDEAVETLKSASTTP